MRPREPLQLASTSYDLLVIGGGIHGLFCAYDAASRGLRTALVEAGDFGAATSFNHQKTVHGGLRSLQALALGRARDAIRERRALARIAPWLLRPLPFIVGTYASVMRSRPALRAAFAIDRWLGRDRNAGLEPELHLPPARLLSRTATMKLFPGIRAERLTGGAQWYDYQMAENDRLTIAVAAAADAAGADLANYVEAQAPVRRGAAVRAVRVRDTLAAQDFEVEARSVINAAGARAGTIMAAFGVARPFPLVKAMNLITAQPAADIALAAPDARGRMLTLVPWRGRAIVGTWQDAALAGGASDAITAAEVERFIADANHAFPALQLAPEAVTLVHRGLVPAVATGRGTVDLLPGSEVLDHRRDHVPELVTVVGAKYTTARATAERAVTLAARGLGRTVPRSRTADTMLPGAGVADHEALAIETARRARLELEPAMIRHLVTRYAEHAASIVRVIAERPDLGAPVAADVQTCGAEIVHAIAGESAVRLTDIVLRRTTLGAAGHPGGAAVERCAAIAAQELGWDAARVRDEIAAVEGAYRVAGER